MVAELLSDPGIVHLMALMIAVLELLGRTCWTACRTKR